MFTALLIAILIAAGAATVVGGGLLFTGQRRKDLTAGADEPKLLSDGRGNLLTRTVRDLRAGDVIQHDGRDFVVEGTLSYDEDGHRWIAGRLVDVDDVRWLVVGMERGGAGALRLLETDDSLEISGYPPERVNHAAHQYVLEKRGTATVTMAGDAQIGTQSLEAGVVARCRWWRYEAVGSGCLVIEQWGDAFRVLRGQVISEADIELIPGS